MDSSVSMHSFGVLAARPFSSSTAMFPMDHDVGLSSLKRAASELRWSPSEEFCPPEKRLKVERPNGHSQAMGTSSGGVQPPIIRGKKGVVWTPELHQRFVDAINALGVEHSCPKKILRMMDVGGLTRENVSSHLQKYRIKLMAESKMRLEEKQGVSRESSSLASKSSPSMVAQGSSSCGSTSSSSPLGMALASRYDFGKASEVDALLHLGKKTPESGWSQLLLSQPGDSSGRKLAATLPLPVPSSPGRQSYSIKSIRDPFISAHGVLSSDIFPGSSSQPLPLPTLNRSVSPSEVNPSMSPKGSLRRVSGSEPTCSLTKSGSADGAVLPQITELVRDHQRRDFSERLQLGDVSRLSLNKKLRGNSEICHLFEYLKTIYNEYWPQRFTFSPLFTTRWDWNQLLISVHFLLTEIGNADCLDEKETYRLLRDKKDELNMYLTGVCRGKTTQD